MLLMNFGFLVFGPTDYAGTNTTLHYYAIAAREPRTQRWRTPAGPWASGRRSA
jgi:NAD(P)H dehydrogenase (quinone)